MRLTGLSALAFATLVAAPLAAQERGAFVVRLHRVGPTGGRHTLAEFTKDDIEAMIAQAPQARKA